MTTIDLSRPPRRRVVKRPIPEIARQQGKTAKELLKELYAKHGTQTGIARELGVSQSTVSVELKRLGLRIALIDPEE